MNLEKEKLHAALVERHGADVQARLDAATVGIAGLGGLGSQIAVHLTRLGVGHLVLVDFDTVDISNLHRQHYAVKHLGMPKPDALKQQLSDINPYLCYETHTERITAENAVSFFRACDIVCEAFDRADQKAMLVETLLEQLEIPVVSGSGMAGYQSANAIHTRRRFRRLYLCGDGESESTGGLLAPRVAVCAAHQAMMVLRLLLGEAEP